MARHVIILGAGASREAGGPLMVDFLDRAQDVRRSGGNPLDPAAFDRTFNAVAQLQRVHTKAQLDTLNVESVFGAFEMAKLFGTLGTLDQAAVDRLPDDIATLIVQTVEHSVRFPTDQHGLRAPRGYESLAALTRQMVDPGAQTSVAIITFNYDVGVDFGLIRAGLTPAYCLAPDRVPGAAVDLLKLHGSTNWFRPSDDSEEVLYTSLERFSGTHSGAGNTILVHASEVASGRRAFIVPPTWSKLDAYRRIVNVWRCAAKHLQEAENIYVMGYSLPPSDGFFRLLYALGTAGEARLRRFWVFDPNPHVQDRFRDLLGQEAIARFEFRPWVFNQAVGNLKSAWRSGVLPP